MLKLQEIKKLIIQCLEDGLVQHETRSGKIDEKNLLLTGKVTIEDVIQAIRSTKGDNFTRSKHHFDSSIEVYIFKPHTSGRSWYIKCYLLEPDVWFISVH